MSSLLIIGGSGFFGKSILDAYRRGRLEKWHITRVVIFSRNARSLTISNPELISESVTLINGDISTCDSVPNADYIIHAAASSDAAKYISSPEVEKKNILSGTTNFCRLISSQADKKPKILYVSSGAVYGASSRDGMPFSESDKFMPLGEIDENKRCYAAAKRDSEAQIIALGEGGLSVAIARCFAFVGKYLPRDQHFAIGNFMRDALNGDEIRVTAQSLVYRSYMYADELIEWLMTIIEISSKNCPVYNVGSNIPIEVRELARKVGELLNTCVRCSEPANESIDHYIPATNKAKMELGLELSISLDLAIKLTIENILSSK